MPILPPTFRSHGQLSRPAAAKRYERERGSAHERGYGARWVKASKAHLAASPLCRYCEAGAFGPARPTLATLVDHLYPHGGDMVLFWARLWWVSACKDCHDGPKQAVERRGVTAIHALADLLGLPQRG